MYLKTKKLIPNSINRTLGSRRKKKKKRFGGQDPPHGSWNQSPIGNFHLCCVWDQPWLKPNVRHRLPAMAGQSQTCLQVATVISFQHNLTWLTLKTALWLKTRNLGYNFCFHFWNPNNNPTFQTDVRSAWHQRWLLGHSPPSAILQAPPTSAPPKSYPQSALPGALIDWHARDPLRRWHRATQRSTNTVRGQGQVNK